MGSQGCTGRVFKQRHTKSRGRRDGKDSAVFWSSTEFWSKAVGRWTQLLSQQYCPVSGYQASNMDCEFTTSTDLWEDPGKLCFFRIVRNFKSLQWKMPCSEILSRSRLRLLCGPILSSAHSCALSLQCPRVRTCFLLNVSRVYLNSVKTLVPCEVCESLSPCACQQPLSWLAFPWPALKITVHFQRFLILL